MPKFGNRMLRFMQLLQKLGMANAARGHVLHRKRVDQRFWMLTGWARILVGPLFRLLVATGVLKRGDALLEGLSHGPARGIDAV